MLMGNLMMAFGQQNMTFQTACHPADVKHYDTQTLRDRFVMEKVMAPDEINLTYSYYDRFIFGGAGHRSVVCYRYGARLYAGRPHRV